MNDIKPFRWLENLGKVRDGLLLIGGAIYALGYIVWAVVAWRNNLGPLPVLQAQYFIAGVPIFLAFVLTYILIRLLQKVGFKWWPVYYDKLSLRKQWLVDLSVVAMIISLIVIMLFLPKVTGKEKVRLGLLALIFVASAIAIIGFMPDTRSAVDRSLKSSLKLFLSWAAPIVLGYYLINIFVYTYSLKVPQEFGGAKSRQAVLDLVKSKFSVPTLNEIVDSSKVQPNNDVLPSRQVTVYFTGSDRLLIEKTDTTTTKKGILEIPRDAIVAIHWLKGTQDIAEALADTSRTKKK